MGQCSSSAATKAERCCFLVWEQGWDRPLSVDGAIAPIELGQLHYAKGRNYEDYLGKQGINASDWLSLVSDDS